MQSANPVNSSRRLVDRKGGYTSTMARHAVGPAAPRSRRGAAAAVRETSRGRRPDDHSEGSRSHEKGTWVAVSVPGRPRPDVGDSHRLPDLGSRDDASLRTLPGTSAAVFPGNAALPTVAGIGHSGSHGDRPARRPGRRPAVGSGTCSRGAALWSSGRRSSARAAGACPRWWWPSPRLVVLVVGHS